MTDPAYNTEVVRLLVEQLGRTPKMDNKEMRLMAEGMDPSIRALTGPQFHGKYAMTARRKAGLTKPIGEGRQAQRTRDAAEALPPHQEEEAAAPPPEVDPHRIGGTQGKGTRKSPQSGHFPCDMCDYVGKYNSSLGSHKARAHGIAGQSPKAERDRAKKGDPGMATSKAAGAKRRPAAEAPPARGNSAPTDEPYRPTESYRGKVLKVLADFAGDVRKLETDTDLMMFFATDARAFADRIQKLKR